MWNKIYLALLGLSMAIMAFFTYYAWSWLQSIGAPAAAIEGFEYHAGLARMTLWITTCSLLVIANVVLWTTRRAWAMWVTSLYFTFSVVAVFFWLVQSLNAFPADVFGVNRFAPFFGVALIVLVAVIVFFDQFIVLRLHEKMYPPAPAELAGEEPETPR